MFHKQRGIMLNWQLKKFLTCYDRITNWHWITFCRIQFLDANSESRRIYVLQIWTKHSTIITIAVDDDKDDDDDDDDDNNDDDIIPLPGQFM